MKNWKPFNDECPRCGNNPVDVFTSAKEDYVYDGDRVECSECSLQGCITCDENDDGIGIAYTVWDDYEDED